MTLKDIKGVGPKTYSLLNRIGIYDIQDLIDYYPFRYNTLTPTVLKEGEVVITGIIETTPITTYIKRNLNKLSFRIETDNVLVNVTIFNRAFMKSNLKRGKQITVIGEYNEAKNLITANNILLKSIEGFHIEPVYHVTNGISSKLINNIIKNALDTNPKIIDYIPDYLVSEYDFKKKCDCVMSIHTPSSLNSIEEAQNRLKYEELFKFMFKINYLKLTRKEEDGLTRNLSLNEVENFISSLPFNLTEDQIKASYDIINDLKNSKRMNRLVLGDVGSGKTVVAVVGIYYNFICGYQSAMLVPTEILASQHYINITKLFKNFGLRVELLKGKTTKKEREKILEDLKSGDIDLLIGTHAVLENDVQFKNLGLVVTDEQHRFGVNQRSTFQNKGSLSDVLYMSATPIPRTYALTIYGDMDISIIKSKPDGRKPVSTKIMKTKELKNVLSLMLNELKMNHQIYAVCPLVENTEDTNMMDTITLKDKLNAAFNNKVPIGLLHGRMKPEEKEIVMNDFKDGKTKILVSTTVIEVGVDVEFATMMVIFNAERFGLATMHQLRGRIGRNSLNGTCILISDKDSDRLKILCESSDGFYISEEDYKMRGEGDLFGTRQSGDMIFKLANLKTDISLLTKANVDSQKFIEREITNEFSNYPEYKKIMESLMHID